MSLIFGKIDYLNLLPLHIFLKKSPLPNAFKAAMEHKKGVPSKLNTALRFRRIDAAVISSFESRKRRYKKLDMGICAFKSVRSVLVKRGEDLDDKASASSNALKKVLKIKGEVIIGDRALKVWLDGHLPRQKNSRIKSQENLSQSLQKNSANCVNFSQHLSKNSQNLHPKSKQKEEIKTQNAQIIDLCEEWFKRTNLPFVFGRFSYIKGGNFFAPLIKSFVRTKIFIPNYILQDYAKSRQIAPSEIRDYLKLIYYKISHKEKLALKMFFAKSKRLK